MIIKTELHWSYTPVDYFEEILTVEYPSGVFEAKEGAVVLTLKHPEQPLMDETRSMATRYVYAVFQARQLLTHRNFKLDGPNAIHYDSEGKRHFVVFPETGVFKVTGYAPDIIIRDADGNVVSDTRAERLAIEAQFIQSLAPKIAQSDTLRAMVKSFQSAMEDPDDELVHLYEIREAAEKEFRDARQEFGFSRSRWNQFGRLANREPIRQGRHRGKGVTRDATDDELRFARWMARKMIEWYAEYGV
jgi:hypothetical protein